MLRSDPLLARVSHYLACAILVELGGVDSTEQAELARLACLVGDDTPQTPICRSILALLELHLLRGSRANACRSASPGSTCS